MRYFVICLLFSLPMFASGEPKVRIKHACNTYERLTTQDINFHFRIRSAKDPSDHDIDIVGNACEKENPKRFEDITERTVRKAKKLCRQYPDNPTCRRTDWLNNKPLPNQGIPQI